MLPLSRPGGQPTSAIDRSHPASASLPAPSAYRWLRTPPSGPGCVGAHANLTSHIFGPETRLPFVSPLDHVRFAVLAHLHLPLILPPTNAILPVRSQICADCGGAGYRPPPLQSLVLRALFASCPPSSEEIGSLLVKSRSVFVL